MGHFRHFLSPWWGQQRSTRLALHTRYNHSERFTRTRLPVRDSAAHTTSSIHGHNEISWLKKKKNESFDMTLHVGDRYFRCLSGMLTYLLSVDRDISDRKEFDGRIASEGQSKIGYTHTHTHTVMKADPCSVPYLVLYACKHVPLLRRWILTTCSIFSQSTSRSGSPEWMP